MLRTFLYISASLTLFMASVLAAPVAVNDSFATGEDTQLLPERSFADNGILQTWVGYDTRPITANAKRFIRARVVAN